MSEQAAAKVTGAHLARTAYLYVRQSTLRQVLTNTESTARQYALRPVSYTHLTLPTTPYV